MNCYEVINKLIGNIEPVGESHTDEKRLENIKQLTKLVDRLITDISDVARYNKDRQEYSMIEIGQHANSFLKNLKEALEEDEY